MARWWSRLRPALGARPIPARLTVDGETVERWRLADLVSEEAGELSQRGGMISADWVAARLEHIADYGCRGPQGGKKVCVHNNPATPDEEEL